MSAGMCRTAPSAAMDRTPTNPTWSPIKREIWSGGTKAISIPMMVTIIKTAGRIRINDFAATPMDCFVLPLSLISAMIRQPRANRFMMIAVVFILTSALYQAYRVEGEGKAGPHQASLWYSGTVRTVPNTDFDYLAALISAMLSCKFWTSA